MANIEMNYYDGSSYIPLYPKTPFTNVTGTATAAQIPNLSASKINSGTFDAARIPNLPASKITSGTFGSTGEYVFQGNVRIKNSSNYGMKLNLGDGDYVYFREPTDDTLEIKAKTINFLTTQTPGLTNNGVAIGGGGLKVETTSYIGNGKSDDISGNDLITLNFANIPFIVFVGEEKKVPLILVNIVNGSRCKTVNGLLHSIRSSSGQYFGRWNIAYLFSGRTLSWRLDAFQYGSATLSEADLSDFAFNWPSTTYYVKSLYL